MSDAYKRVLAERKTQTRTYQVTHEGKTYTRRSWRVYTHAVVLYLDSIWRSRWYPDGTPRMEPREPYVWLVNFFEAREQAEHCATRHDWKAVILPVEHVE